LNEEVDSGIFTKARRSRGTERGKEKESRASGIERRDSLRKLEAKKKATAQKKLQVGGG